MDSRGLQKSVHNYNQEFCFNSSYMIVHVHERSVIETRQSKATTPEDNSLFLKRKRRAASGRTQTRNILHTRQTLYQLNHRGSSAGQAESVRLYALRALKSMLCKGVHCTLAQCCMGLLSGSEHVHVHVFHYQCSY